MRIPNFNSPVILANFSAEPRKNWWKAEFYITMYIEKYAQQHTKMCTLLTRTLPLFRSEKPPRKPGFDCTVEIIGRREKSFRQIIFYSEFPTRRVHFQKIFFIPPYLGPFILQVSQTYIHRLGVNCIFTVWRESILRWDTLYEWGWTWIKI